MSSITVEMDHVVQVLDVATVEDHSDVPVHRDPLVILTTMAAERQLSVNEMKTVRHLQNAKNRTAFPSARMSAKILYADLILSVNLRDMSLTVNVGQGIKEIPMTSLSVVDLYQFLVIQRQIVLPTLTATLTYASQFAFSTQNVLWMKYVSMVSA